MNLPANGLYIGLKSQDEIAADMTIGVDQADDSKPDASVIVVHRGPHREVSTWQDAVRMGEGRN
jgi:hypothetical protein